MSAPTPIDVAGVMLRSEEEATRAIEAQFRGVGPWSDKDDQTAADGLGRALAAAGPWSKVFARVLAGHLEDADVEVRTLAVFLCERVAKEVGPQRILQALERSAMLFDGVKPVGQRTNHPELRWSLLTALGRAVGPEHAEAIRLLRKAAHEERGHWLLGALTRLDLEWLLANAREVVPRSALGGALIGMPDTATRQALIRALAPWTDAAKQAALAGPFWAVMPDAAKVRLVLDSARTDG